MQNEDDKIAKEIKDKIVHGIKEVNDATKELRRMGYVVSIGMTLPTSIEDYGLYLVELRRVSKTI